MLGFMLIAILPVTIVNIYYYIQTRSFIQNKVVDYNQELVKQVARQLDTLLVQVDILDKQVVSYFVSSRDVSYTGASSPSERVAIALKTENYLKDIRRSLPANTNVYVLLSDGTLYSTNNFVNRQILLEQEWFQKKSGFDLGEHILPTHIAEYYSYLAEPAMPRVISFITHVVVDGSAGSRATVQIDLNYEEVKKIVQSADLGEGIQIDLRDSQGGLIFASTPPPNSITIAANQTSDSFLFRYPIPQGQWEITARIPATQLFSQLRTAGRNWIVVTLIVAAFSVLMSYWLSREIVSPLNKLIKGMKKAGEGVFDPVQTHSRNIDILTLYDTYNRMVQRIDGLMKNVVEKETEKTNAQLKALEAQINPHFLYNTLETIRSIALQNHLAGLAEMTKSLADMFRYSIDRKKEFVTLEEELKHVRDYMNIQRQRYGEKIDFECLIDPELLDLKVIKLILQPVVENAVFHGLELKPDHGRVILSGYLEEDELYLHIVDDGLGIRPEIVDQLNRLFSGMSVEGISSDTSKTGIGLSNVDSRIKLFYGQNYGLWVNSAPGSETVIRVHLPIKR
jgi:two-component system sensor histidine kinase YesM